MSIASSNGKGKLVIPGTDGLTTQKDIARLYERHGFPVHPWIRTKTKISARGKRRDGSGAEFHFNGPEVIETEDDIDLWSPRWQCGFACSWRTGLVVLDVDDPDVFDMWGITESLPDTLRVATGRTGGYHLYLDFRHLRSVVPIESWPVQGDIPGGTIKTNGFVAAPGSRHPNGQLYRVVSGKSAVAKGSLELLRSLADFRNVRKQREAGSSEPGYLAELWKDAMEADWGHQHDAVRNLVNGLQKEASMEAITSVVFPLMLKSLPSYDTGDPWSMSGLRELLGDARTVATAEEEALLASIAHMVPRIAGEEGEDWFWNSREDLARIRQWAQAQLISPWALLGEILTEVIARVPPTFVLPDLVGGYGTLNMLFAVTGESSSGKGGASAVLEQALSIDEPELDFMRPERWGAGSGEGLVKNYAYRSAKEGQIRTAYTSIVAVHEVKTLSAIVARSGETLTGELNKFYMGEPLGFGYGDPTKRLNIPRYSYRGMLIAGVQPEHSGIIVNDDGSGLARRWMLLNAIEYYPPETRPAKPEAIKWALPQRLYELDHDAEKPLAVMDVCDEAASEIVEARDAAYRGKGDWLRGHILYTQEKFAAGLAILAMRTELTEEDWRLAAYAMSRSDRLRDRCLGALRKQKVASAREDGKMQGIREVSAEEVKTRTAENRSWKTILKHIPDQGRISYGKLVNKVPHLRSELKVMLAQMATAKVIVAERGEYQGQAAMWYSKPKKS